VGDAISHRIVRASAGGRVPSPVPFAVSVDVVADRQYALVVACGELDVATVGLVRDTIAELTAQGFVEIVLDLRDLTFMDSTGVQLLMEQDAAAREACRTFSIVDDNPTVRQVLQVTGLEGRFAVASPSAPDERLDRGIRSS
jgi:anti-anti-sigma factor